MQTIFDFFRKHEKQGDLRFLVHNHLINETYFVYYTYYKVYQQNMSKPGIKKLIARQQTEVDLNISKTCIYQAIHTMEQPLIHPQ